MKFSAILLACFLGPSFALAADRGDSMQRQNPVAAPSGFYAGVSVGGIGSRIGASDFFMPTDPLGVGASVDFFPVFKSAPAFRKSANGLTGGVHAGYRTPLLGSVFGGIEADYRLMRLNRSSTGVLPYGYSYSPPCPPDQFCVSGFSDYDVRENHRVNVSQNGLLSVRGRVGFDVGRTSFYLTGGVAAAAMRARSLSVVSATPVAVLAGDPPGGNTVVKRSTSLLSWGSIFGGGIEQQLTDRLSVRAEVLRYSLGSKTIQLGNAKPQKVTAAGTIMSVGLTFGF